MLNSFEILKLLLPEVLNTIYKRKIGFW